MLLSNIICYYSLNTCINSKFSYLFKRKKKATSIEVMMNENGGSIPTDSEECTLHLLYFYLDVLITTKRE